LRRRPKTNRAIPCLLLGNKIDLCTDGKWEKSPEEMQAFVDANGFIGFFQTSAREGTSIDIAARALVKYVIENKIEPGAKDENGVNIAAPPIKRGEGPVASDVSFDPQFVIACWQSIAFSI
jgi:GTPase SAR1 family protein